MKNQSEPQTECFVQQSLTRVKPWQFEIAFTPRQAFQLQRYFLTNFCTSN